jgi:hypothetical protein
MARQQPEIMKDCLKLIFTKLFGDMTKDEYVMGLTALEKKYPHIKPYSFLDAANDYAMGKQCSWWPSIPKSSKKVKYLPYKDNE